jgi:phosphoglycolate phosphatase-like HAD superfamily hydrolase
MTRFDVDVVLFDLDGTLADTAPELVDAINDLRASLRRQLYVANPDDPGETVTSAFTKNWARPEQPERTLLVGTEVS